MSLVDAVKVLLAAVDEEERKDGISQEMRMARAEVRKVMWDPEDPHGALNVIQKAVREYHGALDARQNANLAAHRLVDSVREVLGMPWIPGEAAGVS